MASVKTLYEPDGKLGNALNNNFEYVPPRQKQRL